MQVKSAGGRDVWILLVVPSVMALLLFLLTRVEASLTAVLAQEEPGATAWSQHPSS